MSDSPFCRSCHSAGKFGQTYKIAGKPLFQCQRCRLIFSVNDFKPIEFEWRTKKAEHSEFMNGLLEELKPKKKAA